MAITLNGSTGITTPDITSDGGLTADGVSFASGAPANTLVTTSSGNVGIGTSSPSVQLHQYAASGTTYRLIQNGSVQVTEYASTAVAVASYGTSSNHPLVFAINTTERARIDTSGNLLVGSTSAVGNAWGNTGVVVGDSKTVQFQATGYSTYGMLNYQGNLFWNNGSDRMMLTSAGYLRCIGIYNLTTGAGANVHVAADGTIYRSTSSLKYKTDVQDATHGLAEVMALRPVTYKGNNDGDLVFGGLIAEEVHEAGLTEFVQYAEDGTPDALAYANMVSLCVKAIQEQQAIITALTERIAALEAK